MLSKTKILSCQRNNGRNFDGTRQVHSQTILSHMVIYSRGNEPIFLPTFKLSTPFIFENNIILQHYVVCPCCILLWFVFLIFISYIYITSKILILIIFSSFISSHFIFTQPMCSKLKFIHFYGSRIHEELDEYKLRGKLMWKGWSACDLSFDVLEEESAWGISTINSKMKKNDKELRGNKVGVELIKVVHLFGVGTQEYMSKFYLDYCT